MAMPQQQSPHLLPVCSSVWSTVGGLGLSVSTNIVRGIYIKLVTIKTADCQTLGQVKSVRRSRCGMHAVIFFIAMTSAFAGISIGLV